MKYADTGIPENLLSALGKQNITELSDIQQRTFFHVQEGRDLFIQADTASGKTLAYLVPLVSKMELQGSGKHFPVILILVPTREIALQTAEVCRKLLFHTEGIRTSVLCGGTDMNVQVRAFSRGADLVIATPARLLDHIRRHTFRPKLCTHLVLDEADVMLSMGFEEDVRRIIDVLPEHQTILLSATYTEQAAALAESILKDPVRIAVEETKRRQQISVTSISCHEKQKPDVLISVLNSTEPQTIVFCNKRITADFVNEFLQRKGYRSASLHSGHMMKQRRTVMQNFRNGDLDILCATDAAGRGIDIPQVETVICYDYPDQKEMLVHRTGRTSRSGNKGEAYLFLTDAQRQNKEASALLGMQIPIKKYSNSRK